MLWAHEGRRRNLHPLWDGDSVRLTRYCSWLVLSAAPVGVGAGAVAIRGRCALASPGGCQRISACLFRCGQSITRKETSVGSAAVY
jgi:hypothetical protein